MFAVGVASFQLLVRKLVERSEPMQILLTLGIGEMLTALAQFVFGADHRQGCIEVVESNFHRRAGVQRGGGAVVTVQGGVATGRSPLSLRLHSCGRVDRHEP